MGIDFYLFWGVVTALVIWVSALTYNFALHKQDIHKRVDTLTDETGKRLDTLEFSLDDIRKAMKIVNNN